MTDSSGNDATLELKVLSDGRIAVFVAAREREEGIVVFLEPPQAIMLGNALSQVGKSRMEQALKT